MASICNNERALFGVMSGQDRKILSLSEVEQHRAPGEAAAHAFEHQGVAALDGDSAHAASVLVPVDGLAGGTAGHSAWRLRRGVVGGAKGDAAIGQVAQVLLGPRGVAIHVLRQ